MSKSSLAVRFGKVVRARRMGAGLTQEKLAFAATLHTTYISLLERGERTPSLDTMAKLSTALGTSLTALVRDLEREGS